MATIVHSERVWKLEFLKYFQRFLGDTWFLCKCNEKDPVPERWRRFRDSAKVRFCCESCSNGWTSMKGRIVFWFYLDYRTRVGYCLFKLYGQKCKKCNKNMVFEPPMWYPEEINKVICNVYNRIGEVYYNFSKTTLLVDRRDGRPRLQHNRELCQACQTGECWNGPGDIINAEGQHVSSKAATSGSDIVSPSSRSSEGSPPSDKEESDVGGKGHQGSPSMPEGVDKRSDIVDGEEEASRRESDDSGVDMTRVDQKATPSFVKDQQYTPHQSFNFMTNGHIPPPPPLPLMHSSNMPPAGFLMSPPAPNMLFHGPHTPSQGMKSPQGAMKGANNHPVMYMNPASMGGVNGSKPAPATPIDLSPSWATHFNLYHALNRLYIS